MDGTASKSDSPVSDSTPSSECSEQHKLNPKRKSEVSLPSFSIYPLTMKIFSG